ncbi:hypothetical protein GCM10028808_74860 [Spirosoma migulaei]
MPSYPNKEFAGIWEKVTERYYEETGFSLQTKPQINALLAHMRKSPDLSELLPKREGGDQEGTSIYKAVTQIDEPTEISLWKRYYDGLKKYAEGGARTKQDEYYEYLKGFFTRKGNLGETNLSLKDIYIEPKISKNSYDIFNNNSLIFAVKKWINGDSISDIYNDILLLLGDPGQGKTSFCFKLLYEIINKVDRPIYFLRLRDISGIEEFYENPFDAIYNNIAEGAFRLENDSQKKDVPITKEKFTKSVVILDGLDEIEKIHNIDKDKFFLQIAKLTNTISSPYKLIITSRKDLDYYQFKRRGVICCILKELNIKEQMQWISNYNEKVNEPYIITYEKLLELNDATHALSPMVKQPILLHIIAQLKIIPEENYNSSRVYDELFSRLIYRYWNLVNNKENFHPNLKEWLPNSEKLRMILQDIALEMLHRNTTYLSHEQIPESILKSLGFAGDDQIKALKTIAIAFYFNYQVNELTEERKFAIEFLHKTFGEYLAAEAIWYKISSIFNGKIKSEQDILISIVHLFNGNYILTDQIQKYLIEIIHNEREIPNKITNNQLLLKGKISDIFPYLFNHQFSYFKENHPNNIKKSLNIYYGIISIFFRIGGEMKEHLTTTFENVPYFSLFMMLLQLKYKLNFNYYDFSFCKILALSYDRASFNYCNFQQSNLERAVLVKSKFKCSNFAGTSLLFSNFSECNFSLSDFSNSNCSYANFEQSIFDQANLEKSIFFRTNLSLANFSDANLADVNFSQSNLFKTQLIRAKLNRANLKDTNLIEANLFEADLSEADLDGSDLFEANLSKAILKNSSLENTLLSGVNLDDADLSNVKFSGAQGMTYNMFVKVKSLNGCTGIENRLLSKLKNDLPHLFETC